MSFLAFTGLINTITCIVLGVFVLLNNRKGSQNIAYFILNAAVAFYSFGYLFWQMSQELSTAAFFFNILMVGIILINNAYLLFVFAFLGMLERRRVLLVTCFAINAAFITLSFNSALYTDLVPRFGLGFWPVPTRLFNYYLVFWFWQCLYGFYWL
jgi:hypothetical protein